MYGKIKEHLQKELQTIEDNGILKKERIINTRQRLQSTGVKRRNEKRYHRQLSLR
jgi:hypothetical protein